MTQENELARRKYPCWIAQFSRYTAGIPSPAIFRKWAAISTIAGALERRVWITTGAADLYPNLFILFVAPPGVGKDQAMNPMRDFWASTSKLNISPASMTHKGMIDMLAMEDARQRFQIPGTEKFVSFQRLLIAAPELGVLLPSNDPGMISALCTLYDCGNLYEERTRGGGEVLRIEKPYIHLIAGSQPKFLSNLLPDDAFQQGITSRMIMVYAGAAVKRSIFAKISGRNEDTKAAMLSDLKQVCALAGPFVLEEDAITAIEDWHMTISDEDRPNHSKLQHYCSRRIMHVLKLTMVYCASRTNNMVISKADFDAALETLREAEGLMPEIFKEMSSGSQASILEEAFNFIMRTSSGGTKSVDEHRLRNFLAGRIPLYQIDYTIDAMVNGQIVKITTPNGAPPGSRTFRPWKLNLVE